jgi:hypothetical protein
MPSITDFTSNFTGGGARADKFRAIITYPASISSPNVQDYIVVHNAILPGSTVSPTIVFFAGRQIPLFGDRQLEPMAITIMNDTSFSHRRTFEEWLNAIQSNQGNIQATANYQQLLGTVQVDQLDRDDSVLKTYIFHNAFPDNLSQIDLDYSQTDQVQLYTVGFAFSHWSSDTTS